MLVDKVSLNEIFNLTGPFTFNHYQMSISFCCPLYDRPYSSVVPYTCNVKILNSSDLSDRSGYECYWRVTFLKAEVNQTAILKDSVTLHRATLNRATVKRRQFTGRQLTGRQLNAATYNRVTDNRATLNGPTCNSAYE